MKYQYIIRLDDACPTMDKRKWNRMESILDNYGIKPLVGVIPNNEDPKQLIENVDGLFWEKVKKWEKKGWSIALHGYNHVYTSKCSGINPMWNKSEFAGLPLEEQKGKISKGIEVFQAHGINPEVFFAPSHTFDENTLNALADCSDIRIISDTIATRPYKDKGFIFVPQIGGRCLDIRFPGIWTFCFHPSTMDEKAYRNLSSFLELRSKYFIGFNEISYNDLKQKTCVDRLLSFIYFTKRKILK